MKITARVYRLFLFLFVFCLTLFILRSNTYAYTNPFSEGNPIILDQQDADAIKNDIDSGTYTINVDRVKHRENIAALFSGNKFIWGHFVNREEFKNEQGGLIRTVASVMDSVIAHPPASGIAYVKGVLADTGFIPVQKAYAQGIGFAGLQPLLPLWSASRNLAYIVLVIVMVVIGFMVIFRMKIDPKTVISIQAAIPKIVLTLIVITFSYAIVGFLIDLMYLAMAVMIGLLANAAKGLNIADWGVIGGKGITDAAAQQTDFITGGWGKLWGAVVFNFGMLPGFFTNIFGGSALNAATVGVSGGILAAVLAGTIGTGGALAVGLGGPILIILFILGLGLLFTLIRLTFLLVNSYIQIIVALVLGPLLLLQEAVPGQSAFSNWVQNLIANLIVFPATVVVIYASWIFTSVAWQKNLWSPPLTPVGGGGELGDVGNPFAVFIGLGIIFLSPSLVANIKKAFHPKPALPVTAGSAFSPVTGGAQSLMGAASQFYYLQMLWGQHGNPGILQQAVGGVLGIVRPDQHKA